MRRGPLLLGAFAGASFLVVALYKVQSGATSRMPDPGNLPRSDAGSEPAPGASLPENRDEVAEVPGRPARDVLAEFWGEDWPSVQERIEAEESIDLDQLAFVQPWEDVRAPLGEKVTHLLDSERDALRQFKVKWPGELDAGWLKSTFSYGGPLDDQDVARIEDVVAVHNEDLGYLADEYVMRLELALGELWSQNEFVRAPLTTTGARSSQEAVVVYGKAAGHGGWTASINVEKGRFPDLDELEKRLQRLRRERKDLVKGYLDSLEH